MSISPDFGQPPYVEFSGIIQMAGQSQSPCGNLATTSILPYRIDFLPRVFSLAERTGGIMVPSVEFDRIAQELTDVEVQVPSPPSLVRFRL